jgi:membrane associated rhomboid family serine protease
MFSMPPVTQALIFVNVLVYLLQTAAGDHLVLAFALWPLSSGAEGQFDAAPHFQLWQLVTYGFLHGSVTHLFFNMLALFMFGAEIERVWGNRRYSVYYFVCVVSAAVAQLIVAGMAGGTPYPTVGASGGVFGLLLAFGMMFPRRMVMLLFPPIPMPAWLLVTLYGALELFLGITGTQQGVAHFAHLGGMAGGFLLIQYWRGRLPIRPGRR